MCRSSDSLSGARRCYCDNPEKRRSRQNLSYHTKKAASRDIDQGDTKLNSEPIDRDLVQQVGNIVAAYREEKESYGSVFGWIVEDNESTVDNLNAGAGRREAEIRAIGAALSQEAQNVAGMTYEEAEAEIEQSLKTRDELYDLVRKHQAVADPLRDRLTRAGSTGSLSDEEHADLKHQYHMETEKVEVAKATYELAKSAAEQKAFDLSEKFAHAHREVIASVRDVGESPDVTSNHENLGSEFSSAISSVFPSDWIRQTNTRGALNVKTSTHRAHYKFQDYVVKKEKKWAKTEKYGVEFEYDGKNPHPEDVRYQDWKQNDQGIWSGQIRNIERPDKFRTDKDGKYVPVGHGWSYGKVYLSGDNSSDPESGQLHETWVRDATYYEDVETSVAPTIRMNGYDRKEGKVADKREFNRIAIHEFAHHVETSVKGVTVMEEAFLRRRTTNDKGEREPLRKYLGRSKEVVREDNFVNVYMGKEYDDTYREVLSMGSEAVFNGSQGGFLGLSTQPNYRGKKDKDSIDFILGSYATL